MKELEKAFFEETIRTTSENEIMWDAQEKFAELIRMISIYRNAEPGDLKKEKKLIEEIAAASVALDQLRTLVPGEHGVARAVQVAKMAAAMQDGNLTFFTN